MKNNAPFSDEQLGALLDNELDDKERADMMAAIRQDKGLAARYYELCQIKGMVSQAYKNPPKPRQNKFSLATPWYDNTLRVTFASLTLILFGGIGGWIISSHFIKQEGVDYEGALFQTIAQLDPTSTKSNKVLLHIDSMNETRVQAVLDTAEQLLRSRNFNTNNKLELEIVANANGLNILRLNSPYSTRIESIAAKYTNVLFLACGIAKQNARLIEGRDIQLIPQAQDIPAALDQILRRIRDGWIYVRG